MILKGAFLLALLVALNSVQAKTRYDNYRLVRVKFDNDDQVKIIADLESNYDVDIWNLDTGDQKHADIMLSPAAYEKYVPTFEFHNIKYTVVDTNVQQSIDMEELTVFAAQSEPRNNIINKFATYVEINTYIDDVVRENDFASTYIAGSKTTHENRIQKVIVLKSPTSTKPVWIDCGIHAREWVSHPTCIYMIDQLVRSYNLEPATSLLNEFEFHILPMVNPDGYEYSRTNTRLWRKNRRNNAGTSCYGVDLNRNYNYKWLSNSGASNDPCSDVFAGPLGNSEPETQNIVDAVNAKKGQWHAFFTVHSYGQYWLLSYGDTKNPPADYDEMKRVADIGANAITASTNDRSSFAVGQSSVLLYITCGSSSDWAKGDAGIKYSYTLELRPKANSLDAFIYGFTLPESRLPNLTKETFAGITAAIKAI